MGFGAVPSAPAINECHFDFFDRLLIELIAQHGPEGEQSATDRDPNKSDAQLG